MAKRKPSMNIQKCGTSLSRRVTDNVMYSYFLIAEELRKYDDISSPESVHAMIGYLTVLRSMIERWPPNAKFEKSEMQRWCEKVRTHIDIAAKVVSRTEREAFKAAVEAELEFLLEFMEQRKRF